MEDIDEDQIDRLVGLFTPTAYGRTKKFFDEGRRLVYYTSADVAMSIIKKREWWLRDASCMSDYSEILHGLRNLIGAYNSEAGQEFRNALNFVYPSVSEKIEEHLDAGRHHLLSRTYISCLSEHLDNEDNYGRLSMWRAYGGTTGVALVLKFSPTMFQSNALNAYAIPVSYWFQEQFESELRAIAGNIIENAEAIHQLGEEQFRLGIFNTFRFMAVGAKHPGFGEEREWRVVFSPTIEGSEVLVPFQTSVDGIPQTIYKIPLADIPEQGLNGIEIPQLIDRVIIGPTQFPATISEAIVRALREAGVAKPEEKVIASDIPIRR